MTKKNIIITFLSVLLVGGLSYGGWYLYDHKDSVSSTLKFNNITSEKLKLQKIMNDFIQYKSYQPEKVLIGTNSKGVNLGYIFFNIDSSLNETPIEYYKQYLKDQSWENMSEKKDKCSIDEEKLCRNWSFISASKQNYFVSIYFHSNTEFEISLSDNSNESELIPSLMPSEFLDNFTNNHVVIESLFEGKNKEDAKVLMMELSNIDRDKIHTIITSLQANGWEDECGCASSLGFYNCGCLEENRSYMFEVWDTEYFGVSRFRLTITES